MLAIAHDETLNVLLCLKDDGDLASSFAIPDEFGHFFFHQSFGRVPVDGYNLHSNVNLAGLVCVSSLFQSFNFDPRCVASSKDNTKRRSKRDGDFSLLD